MVVRIVTAIYGDVVLRCVFYSVIDKNCRFSYGELRNSRQNLVHVVSSSRLVTYLNFNLIKTGIFAIEVIAISSCARRRSRRATVGIGDSNFIVQTCAYGSPACALFSYRNSGSVRFINSVKRGVCAQSLTSILTGKLSGILRITHPPTKESFICFFSNGKIVELTTYGFCIFNHVTAKSVKGNNVFAHTNNFFSITRIQGKITRNNRCTENERSRKFAIRVPSNKVVAFFYRRFRLIQRLTVYNLFRSNCATAVYVIRYKIVHFLQVSVRTTVVLQRQSVTGELGIQGTLFPLKREREAFTVVLICGRISFAVEY